MLARMSKKALALLMVFCMMVSALSISALAIEGDTEELNGTTVTEFHFMNRGQFDDLFRELMGLDADTPIWDTETAIQVFSATESSAKASQMGAAFNGYSTNTLIVGSFAPLRYIQPEDVVKIEMTCTYWDGFLNLHRNRETVEIPLNRLRLETYNDYYVEYYVSDGTAVETYYDVTFDLNGGDGENFVMSVRENSTVSEPAEPTRSGYTFLGWFADGSETEFDFNTPITGNITLTAKWQLDEPVTETHDAWFFIRTDGEIPVETGSTDYDSGNYKPAHDSTVALKGKVDGTAAWTNYSGVIAEDGTINGEKLSEAFASVVAHIKEAPSAEAIAEALGSSFDPETQGIVWYVVKEKADDVSSGCPGWHVDGVIYTKGSDPAEQFRTLTYYMNDGTDAVFGAEVYVDGVEAVIKAGPTREDYEFTGWNTQADGKGTSYAANATIEMTADVELYAQWEPKGTEPEPDTYTITFKTTTGGTIGGGTEDVTFTLEDGAAFPTVPTTAANSGYTFDGWYDESGNKVTTWPTTVTASATYTAKGTEDGSVTPPPTPTYDYYRVTVNYLDRADGSKIAESYVSPSHIEGSNYDVSAYDAIAIEGYTYDATEGDAVSGRLNSNKTVNVYYVADETDIDDGETPTTDLPDVPGEGGGETDIGDGETPTTDLPDTGDTGSETDIPDTGTPTGSLPQTGTQAQVSMARVALSVMALTASVAAAGLALILFRKSRKNA